MAFLKIILPALAVLTLGIIGYFAFSDIQTKQTEKTETYTASQFNN